MLAKSARVSLMPAVPECQYLLMVTARSEFEAVESAALERGYSFARLTGKFATYFDLGVVGMGRVLLIRTAEGPFSFQGSAAQAFLGMQETRAVGGIVTVGMCFGVDRERQSLGDVIVSTGTLPYDQRGIISDNGLPRTRYRADLHSSNPALRELFKRQSERARYDFRVSLGTMLTGGAHIACSAYRDHLVRALQPKGEAAILGGDMEGAGLLGLSDRTDPKWCMVKSVCDFADENRDIDAPKKRTTACRNAAHFVLDAIRDEGASMPAVLEEQRAETD